MSVFSPVTWAMSAVQLVSTTTSQLATLNSIQAAFVASTYWEQETTGTSSLGYKYIVVRPKAALGSIYADFRVFLCERVNFATNRTIADATLGFNTTTAVMAYFCPDGGALTFTAANIETGDIWPGTNYKNGTATMWHSVALPCTALWLYEGNGIFWLASRQTATSHSLLAIGNIMQMANSAYIDNNSASVEIGVPSYYSSKALANTVSSGGAFFGNVASRSNSYWTKTSGVAARVFRSPVTAYTGAVTSWQANASAPAYDTVSSTATFMPICLYGVSTPSLTALRGVYASGPFKTRTTIQTAGSTIGFTFMPDDATASYSLAFMNT